ncbi:DnaD domain protein [Lactobacillus jensenii]|uniref:DnaD domain protein n=1 Tax=Lactobacillus jensenii TaxID=109790 RepID=UPI0011918940|nr:DnaD domain protein [Lactobacillus jensenii]MDK7309473.1 DnaD domain protein [Lactobacillus jensenii]TVV21334.1 DnaD domain protein [Lactobacillus jensenii]
MKSFFNYRSFGFTTLTNALLASYSKLGLSDSEFLVIIQLESFAQDKNLLPSENEIAARTNMTPGAVSTLLQNLLENDYLELVQNRDEQGLINNEYSLEPLYIKLDQYLQDHYIETKTNSGKQEIDTSTNPVNELARQFEIEFGRLLSPIEREEISAWLTVDHYDPEVIKLALREAILSQVYNFKYVDRILLNWQKMGLKTPNDVTTYLGDR